MDETERKETIERLNVKISALEEEGEQLATQCIHSDALGRCTLNDQSCPFYGCDCSQSYKNGVREAKERGFEGF